MRISDPCYEKGTWCAGSLENVKKGEWNCFLRKSDEGDWGIRNAEIMSVHSDINPDFISYEDEIKKVRTEKLKSIDGSDGKYIFWELTNIHVGVDSGQAGIFDENIYPNTKEEQGEYGDSTSFYGKCCDNTLNDIGCGVIEGGFVSRSGYGDGGYNCFVAKKDDEIVAINIIFIGDDEEE